MLNILLKKYLVDSSGDDGDGSGDDIGDGDGPVDGSGVEV